MRILLIESVVNIRSYIENKYMPLGLGYIASYLRKNLTKIEIKIINSSIEDHIKDFKPDIVGISSVTQNFNKAKEIAKICKSKGLPVVMGGVHISSIPSCLNKDMDIAVLGEGEETFLQLVKLFHGKWSQEELEKVDGIAYRNGEKLKYTSLRRLIDKLDELPFPARDLLGNKSNEAYVFTSRGCPYKCVFCSSSHFWKKYRVFSASYVVEDLKDLLSHYPHVRTIKMFDDLFIADRVRLKEVVRLLKQEGLHKRCQFIISSTANLIDDEAIALLKEMNVSEVGMGLESGCETTLRYLKRGVVTVQDNINALKRLKASGIWVTGSFIIGSPNETKNDALKTLHFIKTMPMDKITTYVLIPFPNTPFWNIAIEKGWVSTDDTNDIDWSIFNTDFTVVSDKLPLLSNRMSRPEIKELLSVFRRQENYHAFRWAIKIAIKRPSKLINYLLQRLRRLI